MERTTAHDTRIRIQIQYIEMPGLCLSLGQLARLCGVSEALCREALATLLWSGFLTETADGTFARSGVLRKRNRNVMRTLHAPPIVTT